MDTPELFFGGSVEQVNAAPAKGKCRGGFWKMHGVEPLAFAVYKAPKQHPVAFYGRGFFDGYEVAGNGDSAADELWKGTGRDAGVGLVFCI